jgi:hypothetical protein
MPLPGLLESRARVASLKSRLDRALFRVHRLLDQERSQNGEVASLIDRWHDRWSMRWDQIAERLELIETQLADEPVRRSSGPQLALVGVPLDGEDLRAMGAG